jgi:glycine cleavage system H protein
MTEFLETTVDKFKFRVATDRYYNDQGVWAKEEDGNVRIGLSDFVQQRNGDVAFADVKPIETSLVFGDDLAVIETIKVNITFASPASGKVMMVNPAMQDAPEAINQDPYGDGWLAVIKPSVWNIDRALLLDHRAYFARMKKEAEEEAKKL